MKNLIAFLAFATVLFLSGCNRETVEPNDFKITEIKIRPEHSRYSNDGFVLNPLSPLNPPLKIYTGDTIAYRISYRGQQKIASLEVHQVMAGFEEPIPLYNQSVVPQQEAEFLFKYVITQQGGQSFRLVLKPRDAKGNLLESTVHMPHIDVAVALPLVYEGKRLYNSNGPSVNTYRIDRILSNQHLKEYDFEDIYALLQNNTAPGAASSFARSFKAGSSMPDVVFAKGGPQSFHLIDAPNTIILGMRQWGPAGQVVQNVQVGDVYAFKAKYHSDDSFVVYGLLRITDVQDDGRTSAQGGHDNDYLQFDIKYFPGYRF